MAAFTDHEVVGVVAAVGIGAEHGRAERRLERVEVVRVGGFGIEIAPAEVDTAIRRWERLTGKEAVLASTAMEIL